MNATRRELDAIFGQESVGVTFAERARTSTRVFVRSQDHLAFANERATGLRMTAVQALRLYGEDALREVAHKGAAILTPSPDEPAATLTKRRDQLGLDLEHVAKVAGVSREVVADTEDPNTRSDIHDVVRIAQALALDDMKIGHVGGAGGDTALATRLKELGRRPAGFSPSLVTTFAEAAWVAWTQATLDLAVVGLPLPYCPEPSTNYGDKDYPAWEHGYYLAQKTRTDLNLGQKPIDSMRFLVEERLRIPVVQMSMQRAVAGATVGNGPYRGILVNVDGYNSNVWVRRFTLAHELGHHLWDSDERLRRVTVDNYEDIDRLAAVQDDPSASFDPVEARANAFAAELLAPRSAAVELLDRLEPPVALAELMTSFGMSYTAARHHMWNAVQRKIDLAELVVDGIAPSDDWRGRESLGLDFFKPASVPISRRGRFAAYVVAAERAGHISRPTAVHWLRCSEPEFVDSSDSILRLHNFDRGTSGAS